MNTLFFLIIIKLAPCDYGIMIEDYELQKTLVAHSVQPLDCKEQKQVSKIVSNSELDMYLMPFGGPAFLIIN